MKINIIIIVISVMMLSCSSQNKIDASSEENMKLSVDKIKSDLSQDEIKDFEDALSIIALSSLDLTDLFNKDKDEKSMIDEYSKKIDGKTFDEIINISLKIQGKTKADKEKEKIEEKNKNYQEAKDLIAKKELDKNHKLKLKDFKVLKSLFYKRKGYIENTNTIELTVKNNIGQAISRVYFKGVVKSPDREVPWAEGDFNYSISGGIENGEELTWKLSPGYMSEFKNTDAPKDAEFIVEVIEVDDANGNTLYSINNFTEDDEKLLNDYYEEYPELINK